MNLKIIYYITTYAKEIIATFVGSIIFVFSVFPYLEKFEYETKFFSRLPIEFFISITSIVLLIILLSTEREKRFWQRYKNTKKSEKPPLIYPDYIALFIFFSFLFALLYLLVFSAYSSLQPPPILMRFTYINLILIFVWLLFTCYGEEKKNEEINSNFEKYSLNDESIQIIEQDLLGREKFIEDLYKEISDLRFDSSFVFGLYGRWGEGKSSILNILESKFKDNQRFIVVNFDPWLFSDEKAILSAFYSSLEIEINKKFIFPNFNRVFKKYQKTISSGLAQAGVKIDLFLDDETIEDTKQKIESYIEQTGKKVLFIIDDIDRLQPKEVLLLFKLARLNARFKNTIFLLSFDPGIVKKYLKDRFNSDSQFLDKIVQKPILLPATEQGDIDNFLDIHLDKLLEEINISKEENTEFGKEFSYLYQDQIKKLFKTLRDAKRYLNALWSILPSIKDEVNLFDFCVLKAISVYYPNVYNDIWRNPRFYIEIGMRDAVHFPSTFLLSLEEEERKEKIKEHVESLMEKEMEKDVLKEMLGSIFPDISSAFGLMQAHRGGGDSREEKRISHAQSFRKYFMLKVPSKELSDKFLEATLDKWDLANADEREKVIENMIFELQKEEKLKEFFEKILVFKRKVQDKTAYKIIRVIYKNAEKLSKKGMEDYWNSEYDSARRAVAWLINDKIDKQKIQSVIEEVITNTPCLTFAVDIILMLKDRKGEINNIYDSADIDKIRRLASERLKKHFVDEKRDIFEELEKKDSAFTLYQWGTNWTTFEDDNSKIVNDYILSLVKTNSIKFARFIRSYRTREGSGFSKYTYDLKTLGKIYNLKELQKLAIKFQDEASLSSEEREVIKLFLEVSNKFSSKP